LASVEDPAVQRVVVELSQGAPVGPELARSREELHARLVALRTGDVGYDGPSSDDAVQQQQQQQQQPSAATTASASTTLHEGRDPVTTTPTTTTTRGVVNRLAQEKSAHAVAIWKRVRAKLDGRDSSSSSGGGGGGGGSANSGSSGGAKTTVAEQVERSIAAAASPDNLCAMYEGWTAWI